MIEYSVIILHFLSDWILQPRAVAKQKASSWKWMAKHLAVIHVIFAILAFYTGVSQWLVLVNTLLHGIIDKFIWKSFEKVRGPYTKEYLDHNRYAEDYWFYFTIAIDQMIHLIILMWIFKQGV